MQWNLVSSAPNTLRGVHVHLAHWDYLHVAVGAMLLGLNDMRPWSPTHGQSALLRLAADPPSEFREGLHWLGLYEPELPGATLTEWPD